MNSHKQTQPTRRELDILQVLWACGPLTVRQVREQLAVRQSPEPAYTTVLTLLQIMVDKGLASRDTSERTHIYAATVERKAVESEFLGDLVDKLFGGSAMALATKAVELKLNREERLALVRYLQELEDDRT